MYFPKKLLYLIIPLIALVVLDITVAQQHAHINLPIDAIPGFDCLFGIVAAAILVFIAKPILNKIIERKSNYYEQTFMPSGYAWFDEALNEKKSALEIMKLENSNHWGKNDLDIEDEPGYYAPDTTKDGDR